MAVGYIYVLTNPAMPGLVKIGRTTDVERRTKELSTPTGVPSTFVVELFHLTADAAEVEGLVHASLGKYRVSEGKEFFSVPVDMAIAEVRRLSRHAQTQFRRGPETPVKPVPKWTCRRCGFQYFRTPEQRYCPQCSF